MSNNEWARMKQIYAEAADLPLNKRDAFVEQACGGDAALREAVMKLLAQGDATETLNVIAKPEHAFADGELVAERFRILRFVGAGGMGEVFAAEDTELGGIVALKTLRPAYGADAQLLARFRREVQLARQVTHPNICRVFDVGRSGDHVFLTMELLEGETLAQRLRRTGPLGEKAALPILRQVTEGLASLHERGIVHRDLKPGNIMVVSAHTGGERAVITDFGLARTEDDDAGMLTQPNLMVGTPRYMAPEQLQGRPATPQSDLFALGLIIFETISGKRPAPGAPAPARGIEAIAVRCLSEEPSERPQSTAKILPAFDGEAVEGLGPPKKSGIRYALAAAAILLAASGGWFALKKDGAPAAPPEKRLVAVLPFQTIGEDRELRALSDGMAEMLSSKLTQLEQFSDAYSVVPSSEIRGRNIDSVERARKLYGVSLAVTGSIQRLGDTMQLTANLVDAASLRQLRSSSFDAGPKDLKALRDGVIGRVVGMLDFRAPKQAEAVLASQETDRAEAYFAYLEGSGYLYRFDVEGNVDRAIASLEKALRDDPKYALAHAALGEAFWRKARATNEPQWAVRAVESAKRAVELGGSLAVPHIKLGEIYAQNGRQQEAIREFKKALEAQPSNAEAFRGLGRAYSQIGLHKEAEDAYLQAARLRPTDWYVYNLLGIFYNDIGKNDQAEQAWIRARDLTPDNEYPYRNLGMLYIDVGRFSDAAVQFEKSMAIKPSFLAHLGMGRLAYFAGRQGDAVVQAEAAIQLEPNNYHAWALKASALAQTPGKEADARAAYETAIEKGETRMTISPTPELRANIAFYYARCGRKAKALEILSQLAALPHLDFSARLTAAAARDAAGDRVMAVKEVVALRREGFAPARLNADPALRALAAESAR